MKRILTLFVFLYSFTLLQGQSDTIYRSLAHEGLQREYLLYVPEAYDGTEEWPLVLNFHGYGINAFTQMVFSDMNPVADTAHFLIAYPQGTEFTSNVAGTPPRGPGFNTGGDGDTTFVSTLNPDDVDFTSKIIDDIANDYKVDLTRVYSTGWSNGGFMSTVLGSELSDRIAAIAPLGGTIPRSRSFEPTTPVPALYIYGTADPISPYEGSGFVRSVEEVLETWTTLNDCDVEPTVTRLPDLTEADFTTVDLIAWQNCGTPVQHLRVNEGGHQWFGGPNIFPFLGNISLDIHASSEIWNFFSRQSLPPSLGTEDGVKEFDLVSIFPNPASTQTQVRLEMSEEASVQISIQNIREEVFLQQNTGVLPLGYNEINLDLFSVPNGFYFLTLLSTDRVLTLPLIVSE